MQAILDSKILSGICKCCTIKKNKKRKKKRFSQTTGWFVFPFILRYLKEQIKQLKEEKNMAVSALARYKVRVRRITIHKHMVFNWGILLANYDLKWLLLVGHGGIWIIWFNIFVALVIALPILSLRWVLSSVNSGLYKLGGLMEWRYFASFEVVVERTKNKIDISMVSTSYFFLSEQYAS